MSDKWAPTIKSANSRDPVQFNRGNAKIGQDPVIWGASDAKAALLDHAVESYEDGHVPDSVLLARARANAVAAAAPAHNDPFNPTPIPPHIVPSPTAVNAAEEPLPEPPPITATRPAPPATPPAAKPLPAAPPVAPALNTLVAQASANMIQQQPTNMGGALPVQSPKLQKFLDGRSRVTLELSDGTFVLPVVAVKESTNALFLFLPDREDSVSFIPKPGTELAVSFKQGGDNRSCSVYYPGSYVVVEELSQIIIALIKQES